MNDPSPPAEPRFRVLFVCIGNVCRSPVAERLLAARLPSERFEVGSAGLSAMVGYAMSRYAAAELRGLGGDSTGFAAQQLEGSMVAGADLVLTATRAIRSEVLAEAPEALRRTFTILEFAALAELAPRGTAEEVVRWSSTHRSSVAEELQDIPDPFRRGAQAHAAAAAAIHRAVESIAEALSR